ncbi:LOW QUALITY PROTEIN: testin [Sphaeramia orbicularis]|uniref:LOW QUALITY PROTEIN: testin n=1 Tax=Sphaeramia orbicularis TaxID=375764 RepID=UPI0011804F4D|nr:LOW QUALITY PROTEIN: testin [Sphaeramia orbicularis]
MEIEKEVKKMTLGHEFGAGAACLKCKDKCEGFELHFWRKICRNCKCGVMEHDVEMNAEENHKVGKLFEDTKYTSLMAKLKRDGIPNYQGNMVTITLPSAATAHIVPPLVSSTVVPPAAATTGSSVQPPGPSVCAALTSGPAQPTAPVITPVKGNAKPVAVSATSASVVPVPKDVPMKTVTYEWVPPVANKYLAVQYIELLPPEKRPVAGTEGAAYRWQQMARQLPEHDQDPNKCHELSPAEVKKMQQFVRKYKDEALGVGDIRLPEEMAQIRAAEQGRTGGVGVGVDGTRVPGAVAGARGPGFGAGASGPGFGNNAEVGGPGAAGGTWGPGGAGGAGAGGLGVGAGAGAGARGPGVVAGAGARDPGVGAGAASGPGAVGSGVGSMGGASHSAGLVPGHGGGPSAGFGPAAGGAMGTAATVGAMGVPGAQQVGPQQSFSCNHCQEPMRLGNPAVYAERAGYDKLWHPACFVCCTCKELLVDMIYFWKKGKLYCGRHYGDSEKPRCAGCDELIFCNEYTQAEGQNWHLKHFCCFDCDCVLAGETYVMENDKPVCKPCYMKNHAVKCSSCQNVVDPEAQRVSYGEHHWHAEPQCFKCSGCSKCLMGQRFMAVQAFLFCSVECKKIKMP